MPQKANFIDFLEKNQVIIWILYLSIGAPRAPNRAPNSDFRFVYTFRFLWDKKSFKNMKKSVLSTILKLKASKMVIWSPLTTMIGLPKKGDEANFFKKKHHSVL